MHGRLAAPPASLGCLNLAEIKTLESQDGLIDLGGADSAERIAELRDFIREALEKADELLAEQFWDGGDVVQLVRSRAWVVEQLLLLAWKKLVPFTEKIGLVAVGGYGRGELHPNSDVDLLILLDDDIGEDLPRPEIEAFVQLLWDAGFYLGHSVRTLAECAEDAAGDVVTTTTFMESRLLLLELGFEEFLPGPYFCPRSLRQHPVEQFH